MNFKDPLKNKIPAKIPPAIGKKAMMNMKKKEAILNQSK